MRLACTGRWGLSPCSPWHARVTRRSRRAARQDSRPRPGGPAHQLRPARRHRAGTGRLALVAPVDGRADQQRDLWATTKIYQRPGARFLATSGRRFGFLTGAARRAGFRPGKAERRYEAGTQVGRSAGGKSGRAGSPGWSWNIGERPRLAAVADSGGGRERRHGPSLACPRVPNLGRWKNLVVCGGGPITADWPPPNAGGPWGPTAPDLAVRTAAHGR